MVYECSFSLSLVEIVMITKQNQLLIKNVTMKCNYVLQLVASALAQESYEVATNQQV